MLRYFPPERRRRLAPVFLVLGLAIVGKLAHDEMPRDQELTFVLPPSVETLRITYNAGDELVAGFERRFPHDPPGLVSHTPSLSPGRYQLAVELVSQDGGVTRLDRSIVVPSDGPLRVSLQEERR
ncbi:MAG TPA: hypothetical protein VI299_21630 [Polyangiales bacterium]